jgi:hypothetical protein
MDKTCLERPELGAVVHRYSLNGMYEQSIVVSLIGPEDVPEQWTAVLLTRNGVEFLSSSAEYRGRFDWVPGDWVYDLFRHCWAAPGTGLDGPSFESDDIPTPLEGERWMTWRARVFRSVSGLKDFEGSDSLIKTVWKAHRASS